MLNVRLTGDHLYGKLLLTWLSFSMSLLMSLFAALSPRDVLEEIWDLIGSVSEGFPTYFFLVLSCNSTFSYSTQTSYKLSSSRNI